MGLSNVIGAEDNHFLMLENKDFIDYCMRQMTDTERSFVKMRYNDELSQKEISDKMGISQMQVSRIEKKVLKKLRGLYFRD